jgi:hypothetical protein
MEDEPNQIGYEELTQRAELKALTPFEWSILKLMAEDSAEHILSEGEDGKLILSGVMSEIREFGKTDLARRFTAAVESDFDVMRGSGGADRSRWPGPLKALPDPSQEGFVAFLKSVATKTLTPQLGKARKIEPSTTGVSMEHVVTVPAVSQETETPEDIGYIRFVRASKLRGKADLSHTVPGYVTFKKIRTPPEILFASEKSVFESEVRKVHNNNAQWAFDGPRSGIKPVNSEVDTIANVDTPGEAQTLESHFPYILITDFISVVFNKATSEIIDVIEYDDMLSIYEDPFANQRGAGSIDMEAHRRLMAEHT